MIKRRCLLIGWTLTNLAVTGIAQTVPPTPPSPPTHVDLESPATKRARAARVAQALVTFSERGDLTAFLERAETEWTTGFRSGQMARYSASIAARKGDHGLAIQWLNRIFEADLLDPDRLLVNAVLDLEDPLDFHDLMGDKDLEKLRATPEFQRFLEKARRVAEQRRQAYRLDEGLQRATPEEAGLDPAALAALVKGAEGSHSSALILLRHGKVVYENYFGGWSRPIEAMSAAKAVASLGMGLLVDSGAVKSIDDPVWRYFPEWHQGSKQDVTIRMLLNHTSGLQALRSTADVYPAPDFVQLALSAEIVEKPGSAFFYNNKAVNLIPAFSQRTSGRAMQRVMEEKLFGPLGIREFMFEPDQAGNMQGMAGLKIHPLDFAKLGQVLLDGGLHHGQRLLSQAWITESTSKPGQPYWNTSALLWWIAYPSYSRVVRPGSVDALLKSGWSQERIAKFGIRDGRRLAYKDLLQMIEINHDNYIEVANILRAAGKSMVEEGQGEAYGYQAKGSFGNYLLVAPKAGLVAVRMASLTDAPGVDFIEWNKLIAELISKSH